MFDYRARIADAELSERLTSIGAVPVDEGLREDGGGDARWNITEALPPRQPD